MKSMRIAILVALIVPAVSRAGDVGVAVTVGEPGFYGHLEVGNFPRPAVVYAQPVLIQPVAVGVVVPPPVYMHVPPGHAKNWGRHCGAYNACGMPVYFVQDAWYNDVYVPEYQKNHGHGKGHGKGHGNKKH